MFVNFSPCCFSWSFSYLQKIVRKSVWTAMITFLKRVDRVRRATTHKMRATPKQRLNSVVRKETNIYFVVWNWNQWLIPNERTSRDTSTHTCIIICQKVTRKKSHRNGLLLTIQFQKNVVEHLEGDERLASTAELQQRKATRMFAGCCVLRQKRGRDSPVKSDKEEPVAGLTAAVSDCWLLLLLFFLLLFPRWLGWCLLRSTASLLETAAENEQKMREMKRRVKTWAPEVSAEATKFLDEPASFLALAACSHSLQEKRSWNTRINKPTTVNAAWRYCEHNHLYSVESRRQEFLAHQLHWKMKGTKD